MPPALIIVMMFLFIVGIMTWFVPTSVVTTDEAGNSEIIYNAAFDADGNIIENAGTDPVGIWVLRQSKALPMRLMLPWRFWYPAVCLPYLQKLAPWMPASMYWSESSRAIR